MLADSEVSRWAYHDGSPEAAPEICELMAPPARLAGRSQSTADRVQKPAQAPRAAREPSGPVAPADDAIPVASSSRARPVGHTKNPTTG